MLDDLPPEQRLGTLFYQAREHGYDPKLFDIGNSMPVVVCKIISADELSAKVIPKPKLLLSPWLTTSSLCMIYAWRGVGKTQVAMGIAQAVACGGVFLGWQAEEPARVLYVDGELPLYVLQQRLKQAEAINSPRLARLDFITPELHDRGMPNLNDPVGRRAIEDHIHPDTKLIILDNISCLVRGNGKENDAESWEAIQEWIIQLRTRGIAVLLVHHANKEGGQRGTSKREDVLDVSIELKRPPGYNASQGSVFELYFQKSRHLYGADAEPKLIRYCSDFDLWSVSGLEDSRYAEFKAYAEITIKEGGKIIQHDTCAMLGIQKSTYYNYAQRFEQESGKRIVRSKAARKGT